MDINILIIAIKLKKIQTPKINYIYQQNLKSMRKTHSFLILVSLAYLTACNSEKDNGDIIENSKDNGIEISEFSDDLNYTDDNPIEFKGDYFDYLYTIDKDEFPDLTKNLIATKAEQIDFDIKLLFFVKYVLQEIGFDDIDGTNEDMANQINFLDIDDDGDYDAIYEGWSGGEGFTTIIFENKNDTYSKVFQGYQTISDWKFNNGKLVSFELYCPPCCAGFDVYIEQIKVKHLNGSLSFETTQTERYSISWERPSQTIKNDAEFSITKHGAALRTECLIYLGFHPAYEGNVMQHYASGSKGKILGTKTVNNVPWLYVCMNPQSKDPKFNKYGKTEFVYGWILQRDTDYL